MNVDMSPKAITERLRLVSQLTVVCLALGKARPVGAVSVVALVEAIDEADRGELVEGSEAIAKQRRRLGALI